MPSIKDIIAGQSVGVGKRVIKAGADKLRGIINDRIGAGMPSFGAFGMTKLTYPLDVVDDPQQGHYIVFTVREQSKPAEADTKKSDGGQGSSVEEVTKNLEKDELTSMPNSIEKIKDRLSATKIENYDKSFKERGDEYRTSDGTLGKDILRGNFVGEIGDRQGSARFSVRPATKRTSTMITLYMPPQVKNITGVTYKDQEMGLISTAASSIADVMGITGQDRNIDEIDLSGMSIAAAIRKIGEVFGMESQELFTLKTGQLFSPRMEFIFDAVKKRVFTYQFSFYPKSEQEAQEVQHIIKTFRKNMLPTRMDTAQDILALNVPNEFSIEYYYKGNENNFINRLGTCLLTDCDVTYGGDRYGTFKASNTRVGEPGASPTETHMTITFQEMDIITQEDVEQGF